MNLVANSNSEVATYFYCCAHPFSVGSSRGRLCSNANSSPPHGGAADCRLAPQVENNSIRILYQTYMRPLDKLEDRMCFFAKTDDYSCPSSQSRGREVVKSRSSSLSRGLKVWFSSLPRRPLRIRSRFRLNTNPIKLPYRKQSPADSITSTGQKCAAPAGSGAVSTHERSLRQLSRRVRCESRDAFRQASDASE